MKGGTWIGGRGLRGAALAGLLAAAWCCSGVALQWSPAARGEVREQTSREHFKSGAALSEAVLRDIAATLQRIDSRLERLEKLAQQAGGAAPQAWPAER